MASMEELFPEFYLEKLTSADFKNNNLVVLDTNILLDVLRLPNEVSLKYMEAIEKVQSNIFIPYIVGLEFNFKKKETKIRTKKNVEKYKSDISKSVDQLKQNILKLDFLRNTKKKEEISNKLTKELNDFIPMFNEFIDNKISPVINEEYPDDLDSRTRRLIDLLGNSIAEALTQEWINCVQKAGNERYTDSIPPGYNDRITKVKEGMPEKRHYYNIEYETQYGDYIQWEEILHKISIDGKDYGPKVIWVTNDGDSGKKDDIFYKYGHEKIGPHIDLLNELSTLRYGYDIVASSAKTATSPETAAKKQLYVINGFRFMELANELTEEQAEYFKTEIIEPVNEDTDLSDYHTIKNKIAKLELKNNKRRKQVSRLIKKQSNPGFTKQQRIALKNTIMHLKRDEEKISILSEQLDELSI
ncbi:PIN-like domain-containing protein [Streptococcus suis]|uniref:PIN-like domain-containing protein n=1 Tax=Streptococcus suis TaxID=1307 RepID=UPI000CF539CA|nr:PIN-like domain-containing protein [Streptococcus suis]MBS0686916.1 hypothetical protein [Streptococcus suis]MBS0713721.1 hypothetical protein [Streptococcus suis]